MLCVLNVILWGVWVWGQKNDQKFQDIQKQLDLSFTLSGYLLEAQDEKAAILAAMRAGQELLNADGCAFTPFDEWKQTLPVLRYGNLKFLNESDWQAQLSEPATRHVCRNCKDKQSGSDCVMLEDVIFVNHVYCVALRCGGREIGVINHFFSKHPNLTDYQKIFLGQLVRLTDLTLDGLRVHTQDLDSLRHTLQPVLSKEEVISQNGDNKFILDQIKYQAVLDERSRLAREIHDGLAQTLAFLKIEAARMQTYLSKDDTVLLTSTLQACYRTLSDAYLDARQAIDNLRRVPDSNLAEWLDMTASDFSALTGLNVDTSNVDLEYVFPNPIKAQLIRIVQESLTNIRKHAQSCTVSISAQERYGEVIVEVKDNGRGFEPDSVDSVAQYGLRSMRERAESFGANLQIISAPGMGTTIRLQIPITEKARQ